MPFDLRGRAQALHVYGTRGGDPVIISSGDGGWVHLAPHLAELLASHGYFVVGVDTRAYLRSFTTPEGRLSMDDEPRDYRMVAEFAARGAAARPVLVGVSEGAGLSVLAATAEQTKRSVAGVIALGLPEINELGWRWTDSIIYVTHGIPHEPTFSTASLIGRLAPLPLALIHSTHDEFVPVSTVKALASQAGEPKQLTVVDAANHRFSGNLGELDRRVLEAMLWVREHPMP